MPRTVGGGPGLPPEPAQPVRQRQDQDAADHREESGGQKQGPDRVGPSQSPVEVSQAEDDREYDGGDRRDQRTEQYPALDHSLHLIIPQQPSQAAAEDPGGDGKEEEEEP